jgi:hypothetical protein
MCCLVTTQINIKHWFYFNLVYIKIINTNHNFAVLTSMEKRVNIMCYLSLVTKLKLASNLEETWPSQINKFISIEMTPYLSAKTQDEPLCDGEKEQSSSPQGLVIVSVRRPWDSLVVDLALQLILSQNIRSNSI